MPCLLPFRSAVRRARRRSCLLSMWCAGVLAFGLAGTVPPAFGADGGDASPVTGLRMSGPDLEVFLSAPPPGEDAAAVLVDAAGVQIASAPVAIQDGAGRALLGGALAAVPGHGPAYRVLVQNDAGSVLGAPFPFLVALSCPPGAPEGACRFRLLPGLGAPGAALVDPALGRALDTLPAGTRDLLAAPVADDPALRGAALTAAWTWAALAGGPPGTCNCFWTLEASLPGDTRDGGAAVGLAAREAQGEEAVELERARVSSLALRQRCVRIALQPAETVTVVDGDWSALLEIPRLVLDGCAEACSPAVSWEAEVKGWARSRAEGGDEAAAQASWQAELTVDGDAALQLEDGITAAAGAVGGEAERSAFWSGNTAAVTLRAAARAEIAAPGGSTGAEAIAAVAWRLAGQGSSDCAIPGQLEVSAASPSRILPGSMVPGRPCDPGQIGLITGPGSEGGCRP